MRLITTVLLLSIAASATAAVYKWVQPDGSVIYSDRPPVESATPAELPSLQEIKIVPPPPSSAEPVEDSQANEPQTTEYTSLSISEPADDSTIVENSGRVTVQLAIDPPLQGAQGDSIAITLDGKEIGQGKGTTLNLTNVDRGKHTLQAAVKNAQGNVLITSSSITFNLRRSSVLQRKP